MIENLPILLLAGPRTGSSAYCHLLAKLHGLTSFTEPLAEDVIPENMPELFDQSLKTDKKCVVKIIAYQISEYSTYQRLVYSKCYKIKLTRQNKIDQITSHYIGEKTKVWNSPNKFARGIEYSIPIDIPTIVKSILFIKHTDDILDNLPVKFDETVTYEELIKTVNLDETGVAKIIPPSNYNELRTIIQNVYDKQR